RRKPTSVGTSNPSPFLFPSSLKGHIQSMFLRYVDEADCLFCDPDRNVGTAARVSLLEFRSLVQEPGAARGAGRPDRHLPALRRRFIVRRSPRRWPNI
ncbi:hypothetical protein, partial [Nitrospirillum bahiense]|uniref:hypothetical protein n=1 Tax=Nitrospirillum amazonense TaxID=28077 RepID=UPI001B3C0A63